jgi:hypothetical protein
MAFQLGHELGHLFMGPNITNNLIETICTALSLELLSKLCDFYCAMGNFWQDTSYQIEFCDHVDVSQKNGLENLYKIQPRLNAEVGAALEDPDLNRLLAILRELVQQCDQNFTHDAETINRGLEMLGAMSLRRDAVPWVAFVGLTKNMYPAQWDKPNLQWLPPPSDPPIPIELLRRLGRLP